MEGRCWRVLQYTYIVMIFISDDDYDANDDDEYDDTFSFTLYESYSGTRVIDKFYIRYECMIHG